MDCTSTSGFTDEIVKREVTKKEQKKQEEQLDGGNKIWSSQFLKVI